MQPPTDSLRHQLHKLAELRANRNAAANHNAGSGSTTTPTPASPHYTLSITRPSGTRVMTVPNYLADQDDYMDPSPINITIDRSVTLIGDGNNIQLPESGLSSQPDQTDGSGTRLTSLAAVIIGALNRADNLVDQTGNPRPLNINIRNGLHVQGSNNTVCAVSTVGETAQNAESDSADGPSSPSQAAQTETVPAGSGEAEGGDRKRRADSEPTLNAPAAQRRRVD